MLGPRVVGIRLERRHSVRIRAYSGKRCACGGSARWARPRSVASRIRCSRVGISICERPDQGHAARRAIADLSRRHGPATGPAAGRCPARPPHRTIGFKPPRVIGQHGLLVAVHAQGNGLQRAFAGIPLCGKRGTQFELLIGEMAGEQHRLPHPEILQSGQGMAQQRTQCAVVRHHDRPRIGAMTAASSPPQRCIDQPPARSAASRHNPCACNPSSLTGRGGCDARSSPRAARLWGSAPFPRQSGRVAAVSVDVSWRSYW